MARIDFGVNLCTRRTANRQCAINNKKALIIVLCMALLLPGTADSQNTEKEAERSGLNQDASNPSVEFKGRLKWKLNLPDKQVNEPERPIISVTDAKEGPEQERATSYKNEPGGYIAKKPRLTPSDFRLIGGYIVPQAFANPGLAIDFSRRKVYAGSRNNEKAINVYDLADMGTGDNVASWPRLKLIDKIPQFWENVPTSESTHPYGLDIRDDRLWVSARGWYTQRPRAFLRVFGKGLSDSVVQVREIPVPTQAFGGGFIKGHPTEWLIGAGGYMSGQGGVAGPTAATIGGKTLITQINFGTLIFDQREKRPPTLWPKGGKDTWQSMTPRNGVGAWGSDSVTAGGVWTNRGLCFWARLHTGEADYAGGGGKFSGPEETWLYTYDPHTYDGVQFHKWPYGSVIGHEVGEDGTLYLMMKEEHKENKFAIYPVIKAFQISENN
jgi:hypothetical protein